MAGVNFFSERFTPSAQGDQRFRELERYVARQSGELYILLNRLERRLAAVEAKVKETNGAETIISDQEI